jgi:predicted nuclease of predicted toxin-antitoxin system
LPTSAQKDADDSSIWQHALAHQAVLVTKDEDFPHRLRQVSAAPVLVWLRIGNTTRKALLLWFLPLLPQITALIEKGERLIEVR